MLAGRKILLGITGSIAAYKTPQLVRECIKKGAEVKIIMTPAATSFVSPLTLSTLSRNPVLIELFADNTWANHVALGRWADVMVIAPLSCHTLSKMAGGQCDNLLLATYLSAVCPVMAAPAMDEDMWLHPATKHNIQLLQQHGCQLLNVGYGELASGLIGPGRMAEPQEITEALEKHFAKKGTLAGKKALVTAGPTYEAIDPVRFIGNHSSGKMGFAIAEELAERGASVTLISGPVSLQPKHKDIEWIKVTNAADMYNACLNRKHNYDIAVMAAAVADYTPVAVASRKIKKEEGELVLSLKKTNDILGTLGQEKSNGQLLIGFALETHDERNYALKKLNDKNADMIVMNSLSDQGAGFGYDTNKATLYFKSGKEKALDLKSKRLVAADIVDAITEISNA